MQNPLLQFATLSTSENKIGQLPSFKSITADHAIPALKAILDENRVEISQLTQIKQPTWPNFALKLEDLEERVSRVWSPISHLNGVKDSSSLREAYQQGIAMLTEYHSEIGQNLTLYQQYKTLAASDHFQQLSAAQQKIVNNNLRDFKLSGAELSDGDKQQYRDLNTRLSQLNNQFSSNVLDATQAWHVVITDESRLNGLTKSALSMAKQLAQDSNQPGWLFNLQIPSYLAVMQYADDAQLRQQMYEAYVTRASDCGPNAGEFDNSELIDEILSLRQQKAQLLGFKHYADYSLATKMANSVNEVTGFLNDLAEHAKPIAQQELHTLQTFAKQHYQVNELAPWDISYYSEKLRESKFAFNDEEVKPYFPVHQVFSGLFEIVARLFDINLVNNNNIETWHKDVQCFDVTTPNGQLIGQLYADLYVRENKRGGAWMDTCIHRRRHGDTVQKPVAFLTCNFTPPLGDNPALLTHDEVETLFHEFGHTLHHLLTEVNEMGVAGINGVSWDAVELPSQFLENWCWQAESLNLIAKHYQTKQPLPVELLNKMHRAKNFQSGMQTLRQIEFALFDIRLHSDYQTDDNTSVQQVINQVRDQVAVFKTPDYNRFQNSFSHIFAGGYAAGYYSYKWSEVLSSDAFGRFEEEGILNPDTGQAFLTSILQRGGVDDPNELFIEFRKRKPTIDALLRHTGILQQTAV